MTIDDDDVVLNAVEFNNWLDEQPEFGVPSRPNKSKAYYPILVYDMVILFEKDDWDRAAMKRVELRRRKNRIQSK